MPSLAQEKYYKNYSAPFFSCATFVTLCLLVLLIILPYFLADFSGGFWKDLSIFFEQPKVTYNDRMILYVDNGNDNDKNLNYFSSMIQLNNYYVDNLLPVPMVKCEEFDTNYDGLIDQFVFKINFYSVNVELIRNIKLVLLFDYHINTRINGAMQTMAIVDVDTPFGSSYVRVQGDLRIRQKEALSINTFLTGNYAKDIFENYEPIEYDELIDIFFERRVSTTFDYDKIVVPLKNPTITQLEVIVNIPSFEEYLVENPSFTQAKFAWIQYLALFIPICVVIYFIMVFIFTNRIFQCTTVSDLPKSKLK